MPSSDSEFLSSCFDSLEHGGGCRSLAHEPEQLSIAALLATDSDAAVGGQLDCMAVLEFVYSLVD